MATLGVLGQARLALLHDEDDTAADAMPSVAPSAASRRPRQAADAEPETTLLGEDDESYEEYVPLRKRRHLEAAQRSKRLGRAVDELPDEEEPTTAEVEKQPVR